MTQEYNRAKVIEPTVFKSSLLLKMLFDSPNIVLEVPVAMSLVFQY